MIPNNIELIDLDDVIRDFNFQLREVYNRYNPEKQITSFPKTWRLAEHYPIGIRINKFYKETHAEEIYTKAPIIEGVSEFLNELIKIKRIYIVSTQPNRKIEEYSRFWIRENNIPYDKLIFTKDKSTIKGEYLLDDAIFNLEKVLKAESSIPICFDRAWNKNWRGKRVYAHYEFLDIVKNHHSL